MCEERAIVRDALPSKLLQLSSTGGPATLRCCCPIQGGQGYQFPSPQVLVTTEWDVVREAVKPQLQFPGSLLDQACRVSVVVSLPAVLGCAACIDAAHCVQCKPASKGYNVPAYYIHHGTPGNIHGFLANGYRKRKS